MGAKIFLKALNYNKNIMLHLQTPIIIKSNRINNTCRTLQISCSETISHLQNTRDWVKTANNAWNGSGILLAALGWMLTAKYYHNHFTDDINQNSEFMLP